MLPTTRSPTDLVPQIAQQAQDSFYHQPAWLDLISTLYGYTIHHLTTTNASGQITGLLPLCAMQSRLTGKRLVALPFSDHCPLLAADEASARDLIEQAIGLAEQQQARYLELRAGSSAVLASYAGLSEESLYVRWLLPLTADAEEVWSALRKPVQRQIKKAQSLGVQVRVARQREAMAHYYRLHLQTRCKKHGMPAQPQRFFLEVWDRFAASETLQLLLAEYQGAIIAGMIVFAAGTTVRYAYGASDEAYLHLAPNNLLMWRAIQWGCAQGYHLLDMGRTARDNAGLMEFKRRWGAHKEPLPYYYYPRAAGLATTSERSWKYRLLTTSWKRLPLAVAGPLGGHLYKHLG
jgi:serine/alanine adding enzyme